MKKLILLSSLLLGFGSGAAFADINDIPTVQVTGEGEIKVEPNQVVLQFGIVTSAPKLEAAKNDNAARTKKVLDSLKALGVPQKNIQTSYVSIYPRYDYPGRKQVFVEHVVTKNFTVTLDDIGSYGKVMDAMVAAGVEQMSGVQYKHSEQEKLEEQARLKAADDAKRKAEALAKQFGQKIGKPVLIQTFDIDRGYYGRGAMMKSASFAGEAAVPDQLAAGESTITARVTVHFKLLD